MKIFGNHSIVEAAKNPNRKLKIFFGNKELYNKLQLKCEFRYSADIFLETNELFLPGDIEDFLSHNKVILLDGIMDPKNLGAIIRTAAALNFFVILRKQRGCSINETVVKCASGGVDNTKIIELTNIKQNINLFKNNRFWCVGIHETGSINLKEYDFPPKVLLVIGGENKGISEICQKELDDKLVIKTKGFSTLNASVAAALAMHQV